MQLATQRLGSAGELRVATDWQPYALQMLETLSAAPALENLAADGGFVPRPAEREADAL